MYKSKRGMHGSKRGVHGSTGAYGQRGVHELGEGIGGGGKWWGTWNVLDKENLGAHGWGVCTALGGGHTS
jgi:hypothetical protein